MPCDTNCSYASAKLYLFQDFRGDLRRVSTANTTLIKDLLITLENAHKLSKIKTALSDAFARTRPFAGTGFFSWNKPLWRFQAFLPK